MTKIEQFVAAVCIVAGGAGCDSFRRNDRDSAEQAQLQANREISEQQREAANKRAEIRSDVSEKTTEIRKNYDQAIADGQKETAQANDEANAKIAQAQANANDKIRAANRETNVDDSELRQWSQAKIDSLNAEIDDAKVKAQKAKAAGRTEFNAGIARVEASRDLIAKDIAAAEAHGEVAVAKFKDDLDARIDRLKTRVEALSKQL